MDKKPSFLIIGVQKSGTTWLQERLRQHSGIFMPRNELHYFDRDENFTKGEAWYLAHFAKAMDSQVVGEKTPDYIWTNCHSTPGVSEFKHKRIKDFRSDIKLIIIFRNPVERFVSAIHHNRRRGRFPARLGVGDLLKSDRYSEIVGRMQDRGLYTVQLEDYFTVFDRTQIKILFHDDIKTKPDAILAEVHDFLGVELQEFKNGNEKRYNDYRATEFAAHLLGTTRGLLNVLVTKLDRHLFSRLPLPKVRYPEIGDADRAYLTDYYRDEMQRLPELVGRSLPPDWKF